MSAGFHVWEYVEEEMEARGWTLPELAVRMCEHPIDEKEYGIWCGTLEFCALRHESLTLGRSTAEALARAFGTSADVWLNLDAEWRKANNLPAGAAQ